jgi:hypothetical protein
MMLGYRSFLMEHGIMKVTRSQFMAYRLRDAIETKIVNSKRKIAERGRRDARIMAQVKSGSLPFTPEVMSWLSRKLDKPSRKITDQDLQSLTIAAR